MSGLARIEDAIAAIGRGEIVVVVDDEDRENEGDLIMAAEFATPEAIAFFLQHTSGVICATVTSERARQLGWATSPMAARRDRVVVRMRNRLLRFSGEVDYHPHPTYCQEFV